MKEKELGNKNTVSHDYMSDNEHFADICNYYIYNGEQVIKPEDLFEKDATEEAVIRKLERILTKSKIRDVLKGVTIKSDGNITYAVIGIENQSEVHYAMPVRNNLYDSLDYASQVAEIAKKNRKQKKVETASEFLSGFTKDDRMNPVVTLVINWSDKKWDGPIRLSDMMGSIDPRLQPYINDYRMNLIDPHDITDFDKFSTELGDVLEFIRRQSNNEALQTFIYNKGPDWRLDIQSVNVINTFTGAGISVDEREGDKIIMCKAIDTMRNESKQEGKGLINKLNVILLEAGRFDDLKRATTDSEYQDQLIKELIDKDYEG